MHQTILVFKNQGRGLTNITADINTAVKNSGVKIGLCHLFLPHTSASLIINENSDPDVLTDLENFMNRLIQDGDPLFKHCAEGKDDMPAHIRTVLTQTSIAVPVYVSKLALGAWQGIYLWEHRHCPHERKLFASVF